MNTYCQLYMFLTICFGQKVQKSKKSLKIPIRFYIKWSFVECLKSTISIGIYLDWHLKCVLICIMFYILAISNIRRNHLKNDEYGGNLKQVRLRPKYTWHNDKHKFLVVDKGKVIINEKMSTISKINIAKYKFKEEQTRTSKR